jgi:hypothetical protein
MNIALPPHDSLISLVFWAVFFVGIMDLAVFFLNKVRDFLNFLAKWIRDVASLINPTVDKGP